MTKSATTMVLAKLPSVLTKEGQTFQEVWNKLIKDKELAKVLVNEKSKPRFGVLQGLSTRIKAHQIPGFAIIKDVDGVRWFKCDEDLDLYVQEVKKHTKIIQQLPFPSDAPTASKVSRHAIDVELEKIENQLERLSRVNIDLKQTKAKAKPDTSDSKAKGTPSTPTVSNPTSAANSKKSSVKTETKAKG